MVEVAITEDSALGLDCYSDDLVEEDANELMSVQRIFHDEKWSKGRPVTSLDWSPKFPELALGKRFTPLRQAVTMSWTLLGPRCTLHYLQAWRLAAQLNCGT